MNDPLRIPARHGESRVPPSSQRWRPSTSSAAPEAVPEAPSPDAQEFRRHDNRAYSLDAHTLPPLW